jgi:voltage-gated potassium channel
MGRLVWTFVRALLLPGVAFVLFLAGVATGYARLESVPILEAVYWVFHPYAMEAHGPLRPETRTLGILAYGGLFFFQVWFAERVLVTLFTHRRTEAWMELKNIIQVDSLRGHVIVVGYGQVGRTIVQRLQASRIPFALVERDEGLYRELVKEGIPAVHGDARRRDVLLQAGIERARILCAVIDNDADNLYITVTARMLNPGIWIVSRAGNLRYADAMHGAGANDVIVPEYEGGLAASRLIEGRMEADRLKR